MVADGKRVLYSSHRGIQFDNLYCFPEGDRIQLTHGDWDHFDRAGCRAEWIPYIANNMVSPISSLRTVGESGWSVPRRVYRVAEQRCR